MNRSFIKIGLVIFLIFLFSYAVNFVWESWHAVFLYEGHDLNAKKYVLMVSYVSAMDGLLILGMYLFSSALWRDMSWIRKMSAKQICAALIMGLLMAAAIEYRRVMVMKTWSYNQLMPTIFGSGISPLFQLSLTGVMAFWLSGKIVYQTEKPERR